MSGHKGYEHAEKASVVSIAVNGLLFILKIFAGVVGHSNAMIADALDTFGDAVTSAGMLIGYKIAKKPADSDHPYGHGKAESIIAKLLAIFLIAIGIKIAYTSAHAMVWHKLYVPGKIALVAAVISIVVKLGLFQYTNIIGKKISSTAMMVYSWNLASDAFSSFAALIGIAGARLGFPIMDPIAAFILAILVIRTGAEGFHKAYDELMDGAPDKSFIDNIRKIALKNPNVKAVKDVKVRKMGLEVIIDMTIEVDKSISVERGHKITDVICENILKKISTAKEVFIHVEPFKRK
ncbi:MAG: cation diffusion facilitator family transporter [Candidatus Omnitrophota bacterium]|nr:cation diffusion facilitator family transporter [Candidatus Omnitrophota bacterium]